MAGPSKGPGEGSSGGGVVELAEDALEKGQEALEEVIRKGFSNAALTTLDKTPDTGGTEVAGSTPPAPRVDLTAPVGTEVEELV